MMSFGVAALGAAREVQIPILAILLIGACAAKVGHAIRARSVNAAVSPTALFPLRLRQPIAIALCASELAIGGGLVVTAGQFGHGGPATAVRVLAALLFGTAVGALNEVRSRRPATGCGCFGDLSDTPVSMRTMARSALLCVAAMASVGVQPLQKPASSDQALWLLGTGAASLALIALLSPEVGEILVRLGYADPCEARRVPVSRTLTALRASGTWRRHESQLAASEPSDVWREGCWRFVVYPADIDGERKDVVFAVYLQARRPPVRAAIVEPVPATSVIAIGAGAGNGTTGTRTGHVSPYRWVSASSRALAARRRRPPTTPVKVPLRPLASAAPLSSAIRCTPALGMPALTSSSFATPALGMRALGMRALSVTASGEQALLRRPRFVPHCDLARNGRTVVRALQVSSDL
jgi:hypothetical protein